MSGLDKIRYTVEYAWFLSLPREKESIYYEWSGEKNQVEGKASQKNGRKRKKVSK